jgi:hypothetical protein
MLGIVLSLSACALCRPSIIPLVVVEDQAIRADGLICKVNCHD